MSKLGLSPEEENQLKTICEYLFVDQFMDFATYNRFEQCFQPLFNNIPISIDKVFKSICGEKKKYINYQRLVNSYLLYKNEEAKIIPDLKIFFEKLFNSILKKENTTIGKPQEKTYIFITPKSCKIRDCISSIKLVSDNEGAIHGLIMEYDDISKIKMYPTKIQDNLVISLDMKLGIVDEIPVKERQKGKLEGIKEEFYRDAVTHVFGTVSQKTNLINFLGFKCVSGKTVFVGYPEGDGFIFGKFGTKFHELKVQMNLDGIFLLQPGFKENRRTNFYLNTEANNLTEEELRKDMLIQDEVQLSKMNDSIQIDKMITTPIIDENQFFNEKLMDEISGNDYKEVVNQNAREWILKTEGKAEQVPTNKILTLDDALKEIEKEKENSKELLKNGIAQTEGKGRRRNKKNKKRAKNGKLHKVKNLVNNQKDIQRWNGNIEQVKNISIISFMKNKENYKKLKEKIKQGIYEELIGLKSDFESGNAKNLIEKIIPNRNNVVKEMENESENMDIIEDKSERKKHTKLISKNMKGDISVFQKGEKREKSIEKQNETKIIDNNNVEENNLLCSDALQIINAVESISGCSTKSNVSKCFTNIKARKRSKKSDEPEKKWKKLGNKIRKLSGVLLLRTIGGIMNVLRVLRDVHDGKKTIPLDERIKLFNILEENEDIVKFLSQKTEDEEIIEKNEKKMEEVSLIPSEHPEEITSLPELEAKMAQINELLKNSNLKAEDKKKIELLKNLYLQQKNILIENKTEDAKKQIIDDNKIDINKYIEKEKEKRNNAKEKVQNQIKKEMIEMIKGQGKAKEEKSINELNPEITTKIFRNQEIYKGKEPWIDPIFKPEKKSLCPYHKYGWILPEVAENDDIEGWESLKWCRVEEIYDSNNYSVFYEGIAIEDIIQGKAGDCYFLSVLGSLCKFPKLLENLFYFKEKTKEHIYGIYLYINGIKKLVLIDDCVPCFGVAFKKFAMAQSSQNEIWVSLIEKAWAKINGNYIRIACGGTANEVFDILTEAYSELSEVNSNEKEILWKKIKDGENKGFVMTAGSLYTDEPLEVGLYASHAFTVLGVYEIKGERVMRLRNPYGECQFNGDWSDISSKWTEDLKQKYNFYKKEEGDFFIGYDDFIKYFMTMSFAKIHPQWSSSKLKIKKSEATRCQLIKVTIPQDDTLVYFQLYSKNPRIPNKKGEYPKTVICNLILADKYFNYIDGSQKKDKHICVEKTLKKGEYYLFCDANYRYNPPMKNHGYIITAYCDVNIPMENVTLKNDVPNLLRKVIINYGKKKGELSPQPKKKGVNVYITKSFNEDIPYKTIIAENTTNENYSFIASLRCRGNKSCCFYCDEIASEDDIEVVKLLKANETIAIIVMYYNISSRFKIDYDIADEKKVKDSIYNHAVFDVEGEDINDNGLKQYILEKGEDYYYIGIENLSPAGSAWPICRN